MRIRWRGLELPGRVVRDENISTNAYGRFTVEPFEQGFGTTIGNSLRRVLLSSLEGAAITSVKIAGVSHEFTNIDGVMEDITDILLNIKGIVIRYEGDETKRIVVRRDQAGVVRAGDMETDPSITILNPEHVIANLTENVSFHAEMSVRRGRGYATAADNRSPDQELDVIPVESVFSPVLRVRFRTEDMRVGQLTNYDRLILDIWTNGSVLPEDALVEAGLILRKHLNPFVLYYELGSDVVTTSETAFDHPATLDDAELNETLNTPISDLNLSVRANNCLEAVRVQTLRDLVQLTEADLLRFRSFGKTSLHEVQRKLAERGLRLGMAFGGQRIDLSDAEIHGLEPEGHGEESEEGQGSEGSDGAGSGPMAAYTMESQR